MKIIKYTILSAAAGIALFNTGCSGKTSSSDGTASATTLSVSGTLGSASILSADNSAMAVDTSNLKIKAIAFTNPPTVVSGDVASDGTFSINLPDSKGAATAAFFLDKTDDSQVGTLVFEDSSSKDMNGHSSQSSSVVLSDSVSLGSVSLGTDGKVTVPVANIASQLGSSSSVSSTTAFDPTGSWYMKAFDGSLPTGYATVTSSCGQGPCIGFPITLVRYTGKNFTATTGHCDSSTHPVTCDSSADGTVGTADRYALSIWGDSFANGMGLCGSKTGFTAAEARAYGGIHIATLPTVEGNSITFGPYTYTHPAAFGGDASPFDKDWMKTGATLTHDLQNCQPTTITHNSNSYNGWACRAKVMTGAWPGSPIAGPTYGWQVGVEGGGCFNAATGKAVNVTNWATIGMGTCSQTDVSSTYGAGFIKNTCTYSGVDHDNDNATPVINLSCSFTGGQVTDSGGAPTSTALTLAMGQYLGQPTAVALTGATCASIGHADNAHTLAAYRCYAEAYWSASLGTQNCAREYRFNWATTNAADFAQDNDRGKPKNAFITNILNYSPDGQTATLEDEEVNTITVNTGATSSTFCNASRRTTISFKKLSSTRMLVDLRQSGQMNSTSAACVGAAKDALAGKNVGGGDLQHMLMPENLMFFADKSL